MILSASRRTDIPAFYGPWFLQRLEAGEVLFPYPRNPHRLGRLNLSPQTIDCIVFWTKNPRPMLPLIQRLEAVGIPFYFQFTLNAYGSSLEPSLPPLADRLEAFGHLSELIGPERVVWRYDPVLLSPAFSLQWHLKQFTALCEELQTYTRRCIFSFITPYRRISHRFAAISDADKLLLAQGLGQIAYRYRLPLYACAEGLDLAPWGIRPSSCIDAVLIEQISGAAPLREKKDARQRPLCRCLASVDIGIYGTCSHGCHYCYANASEKTAAAHQATHDPQSPLMIGWPKGDEVIAERTRPSLKITQPSLFEDFYL